MQDRAVIDVWVADLTFPGYMDRWYRLGEEFEKTHPEYTIKIRGTDFRLLSREIARAAAEGNSPTIAEYYFYMTPQARDARDQSGEPLFTSVERAMGGRREILGEPAVLDDIIPSLRQFYAHQDDLMSMPIVGTTMLLYGNKTLLEAAGVSRMPRTWEELEAACAAVTAMPDGPRHAITWANHGFFFQQGAAALGGGLADQDDGRSGRATTIDLTSMELMTWLAWWQRMHREGSYLYTGGIPDWVGNLRAFAEQEVAFRVSSSNDVNYMVQASQNSGFEIEVGRFPYRDGTPYGGHLVAGTSLWLRSGLDQVTQDGALAFMQYLNNPGNAADQHRINSFVPATRAAFELLEKEGWFDRYPHHRVASDQLGTYPPGAGAGEGTPTARGAMIGDYAGIQDVMTLAMADVLQHGADLRERFTQATTDAQALLDAYNADCAGGGPQNPTSLRMEYFRDAEEYSGASLDEVVPLDRKRS